MKNVMIYSSIQFIDLALKIANELEDSNIHVVLPSKFNLENPTHISDIINSICISEDKKNINNVDEIYIVNKYGFIDYDTYKIIEYINNIHKKIHYLY